jgi:hypothetical protein
MTDYDIKFVQNEDPFLNGWLAPYEECNRSFDEYLIHMNFGVKKIRSPNSNNLDMLVYSYYKIVDKHRYFLSKIKYGF